VISPERRSLTCSLEGRNTRPSSRALFISAFLGRWLFLGACDRNLFLIGRNATVMAALRIQRSKYFVYGG